VISENKNAFIHSCIIKIINAPQTKERNENELVKSIEDHLDESSMSSLLKFKTFDQSKTRNLVELIKLIHQAIRF
jgi:hypothetical protein